MVPDEMAEEFATIGYLDEIGAKLAERWGGVLTTLNLVTPAVLLTFTFLTGIGAALVAPAWQAIVPSNGAHCSCGRVQRCSVQISPEPSSVNRWLPISARP